MSKIRSNVNTTWKTISLGHDVNGKIWTSSLRVPNRALGSFFITN